MARMKDILGGNPFHARGAGFGISAETMDKALIKQLKQLPEAVQRSLLRQAGQKAMTPVLQSAKGRVKSTSKHVARAMARKTKTYPRKKAVSVVVGADTKKLKQKSYPSNIDWLIEFGQQPHQIAVKNAKVLAIANPLFEEDDEADVIAFGRVVKHPGTAPHPFIRPAWDSNKSHAMAILGHSLRDGINREAVKTTVK